MHSALSAPAKWIADPQRDKSWGHSLLQIRHNDPALKLTLTCCIRARKSASDTEPRLSRAALRGSARWLWGSAASCPTSASSWLSMWDVPLCLHARCVSTGQACLQQWRPCKDAMHPAAHALACTLCLCCMRCLSPSLYTSHSWSRFVSVPAPLYTRCCR